MPIYMDLHIVPGVKAAEAAEAHRADLLIEGEHECKFMTYWVDEGRGHIFCLIDAPTKEAVELAHARAHGLIPHKILEVQAALVESFLGRINDPTDAEIIGGHTLINESSFRVLLVVKLEDFALTAYKLGITAAKETRYLQEQILSESFKTHNGTETLHREGGCIASFTSAADALDCAKVIYAKLTAENEGPVKLYIHAGEPVARNERFFGDTIQLAERMHFIHHRAPIGITSLVKSLLTDGQFNKESEMLYVLSPDDEALINLIFNTLQENWEDAEFDIDHYCESVAMSKSGLYRKTKSLTGHSPNNLLKEFRLDKAKELLKNGKCSIAEVAFATGFASPSYFAKCFKSKFGLVPVAYTELL